MIRRSAPSVRFRRAATRCSVDSGSPFNSATRRVRTRLEIQLAAHGGFGDRADAVEGPGLAGQLVDHFVLNQRRVHVERNEPANPPVDVVALPGEIDRGSIA